jgi:kynurenine formamidase
MQRLFQLAHVDRLPVSGFDVTIAPLKLKGGSGGPTRVFAVIHGNAKHNAKDRDSRCRR